MKEWMNEWMNEWMSAISNELIIDHALNALIIESMQNPMNELRKGEWISEKQTNEYNMNIWVNWLNEYKGTWMHIL